LFYRRIFDMSRKFRYCVRFPKVLDYAHMGGTADETPTPRAEPQPARHRSPLAAITRAEQVYSQLRSDILSGRVLPGTKLRFADLTERYECSTSVVREGLTRLAEQGLVLSEPQHGFRVMPVSADDLDDLTTARCVLEGLVLRMSIENGDIAWESEVVAAHHALDRTPMESAGDPALMSEDWTLAHSRFHTALLAACRNQRLRLMALSLRDAAELYRRWSRPLGHDDHRDVRGEHRALVDAALRGDATEAVRLLEEHLRRTTRALGARERAMSTG
jgi:DNA-binding GntR family transcriptional regulator